MVDPHRIIPPAPGRRPAEAAPLLLVPDGHRFQLVKGHTTYRRAMKRNAAAIPALIRIERKRDPFDRLQELALLRSVDPIEEAEAVRDALAGSGFTQRQLAAHTGVPQPHISKRLKLLKLPEDARDAVRDGLLSVTDALRLV
jgi:hypothetical protein